MSTAINTPAIGDIETKVIDDLTHSIVNKIVAGPTKALRDAAEHDDEEMLDYVAELSDQDFADLAAYYAAMDGG